MAGKQPKKFRWTDKKVKAFARAYTQGRNGYMRGIKTMDEKLKMFKSQN